MQINETWKAVPSVPTYEASTLGRIRRVPHSVDMPNGGQRVAGGTAWAGSWNGVRYTATVQVGHLKKTLKVARMVCEAFHGPPPPGKPVCMHLDENARNNMPDNLQWGTQKENLNAPGFIAYCRSRRRA